MLVTVAALTVLGCSLAALPLLADPALQLERTPGGFVVTNTQTNDRVVLDDAAPLFDFGAFRLGGREAGSGRWERTATGWRGEWAVAGETPAALRTEIAEGGGLLRVTASVRLERASDAVLREVIVATADLSGQSPQARSGWQSYPVLGRSVWCGIAFPVATTRLEGERAVLAHAPGARLAVGEWYRSRTAVFGGAAPGESRRAFERAIAARRPAPRGVHFNYNSWWTSPVPYTEADIRTLVEAFRDSLYRPHGVAPDSFTIDMGWSRADTVWGIDPKLFPTGFRDLLAATSAIGSSPGLWISPSAVYPPALDIGWARSAGYETGSNYACLGGPRYREAFTRALVDIVTRFHVRQVKFDGYVPTCNETGHGHEPGPLSAEAIAEGIIGVFAAVRRAAPELWMEPTCFGYDPSPWWLEHCNSVIGTFGDDSPPGRVPCPDYRESATSARDFYNLHGARDILAPIAAQEVLGIIHQTPEPLQNDAVTCVLRGHQFLSLYVHPAHMTPRRWEFLAALMRWARANAATLENTVAIQPASWREKSPGLGGSMPREPYGYGHWSGERGLLMLRNPWIAPATVRVNAKEHMGAPADASGLRVRAIYPEPRAVTGPVSATDEFEVALRPYETTVLEVAPGPARASRATRAFPPPVAEVRAETGAVKYTGSGPVFAPDATRSAPPDGPRLRVRLGGTVRMPGNARHELLLLVENPAEAAEPECVARVNGQEVRPSVTLSSAGWKATGMPDPEHWVWLRVPLAGREARVEVELRCARADDRVSAWVAATTSPRASRPRDGALPPPEKLWLAAVPVLEGAKLEPGAPVERIEAKVERIDGVFLDALEPLEVTQGWGTLQRNRSVWEKPMTIAGRRFRRGLGTHAPSRIVYELGGKWRRFRCWAGADQATGPTITMEVRVDGRTVWRSAGLMTRDTPPARVDVSVRGAQRLELIVGDGGNGIGADHANWADAMLLR